jgi:tetratricopeptide (TPR) repeat protein
MFEKAIDLDPEFHRAYLGLAWFHVQEIKFQRSDNPRQSLQQADELARHAVELDRPSAWSYMILGQIYIQRRQFRQAVEHYERALALNPSDAFLLMLMAESWCYLGRSNEAIELALKAIRLNPNHPFWYERVLAWTYYSGKKYAEALSVFERMANLSGSHRMLAATYAKLGQVEKARAVAKEFLEDNPQFSIARWAAEEPFENSADLEDYVEALRKSGFPE